MRPTPVIRRKRELIGTKPTNMPTVVMKQQHEFRTLLPEISYAQTPESRLDSLHLLLQLLRHHDSFASAFQHGADRLLCWQLTCQLQENTVDEATLVAVLSCLELLWKTSNNTTSKCDNETVKQSIVALQEVLPWLLHSWESFLEQDRIVIPVMQVLRTWCKIKDSTIKSRVVQSGIVTCIQNEARRENEVEENQPEQQIRQGLLLGLIKDLTFRASSSEKDFIYSEIHDIIIDKCCNEESSIGLIESISATLWNLASDLGKTMAQDEQIWCALKNLWETSVQSDRLTCRRNVSSVVGTIVSSISPNQEASILLIQQQTWLLPSLINVLQNETDNDWRRRCMRTVRCLASSEWGRNFLWKFSPSIEDFVSVLLHVLKNEDDDEDTSVQACHTIASVVSFKGMDIASLGPVLETTLIQTLLNCECGEKLILALVQTLSTSLRCSPWKRVHPLHLISSLTQRVYHTLTTKRDDPTYHGIFSELLVQFFNEEPTKKDLVSFSTPCVVEALAFLIEPIGPDFEESRQKALGVIASLASNTQCRKLLAENEAMMTALVNFCLIAKESQKEQAKNALLLIVPEL